MRYVAGIEVSWEESRVGVVDGEGRLVRAAKVASEPEALAAFLGSLGLAFREDRTGGGPVVAVAACRARASRPAVGAYVGRVPRKYQSGEIDRTGRITKVGDAMVRTALFEAANVMLSRTVRFSALKAWALRVASRHGMKAKVALARKLAVVLHRLWVDGTAFGRDPMPAAARAA